MERRRAARRGPGGGEGIQAPRADRPRLAAGAASIAAAAATGTWIAVIADDGYLVRATLLATAVAVAFLTVGLALRRPIAIPAAVVLLAAPYVGMLAFEIDGIDTRAPMIAALLFSVAELGYWSLELRGALASEPGTYLRRLALLAGLSMGTIAGGTVVLVLAEQVAADGPAFEIAGAAAAVGAIALLAVAGSRRNS